MTAYNKLSKLKSRPIGELNGLLIGIIEYSLKEKEVIVDVVNKTTTNDEYNQFSRLGKGYRFLIGLTYSTLGLSRVSTVTEIDVQNSYTANEKYNSFNEFHRTYSELNGLLVNVVELSKRENNMNLNKIRLVKPIKTYKAKISLMKKYSNNIKV